MSFKKNRIAVKAATFILCVIAYIYKPAITHALDIPHLGQLSRIAGRLIELSAWFSFAVLTVALLNLFLWDLAGKRLGRPVPKLLQQISNVSLLLIITVTALSFILDASIPGLIAGSSVLAAVIGLAVTRMISDVFSGFALSIENAYSVGDWLEIEMKTRPLGFITGKVVEMNWRATRLLTKAEETLIIPNSEMARMRFVNFSIPHKYYRTDVQVHLSHTIPPERVKRILSAAIKSTPGILKEPESKVTLLRFTDKGVLWCARIWIRDYSEHRQVVKTAHETILNHLQVAGINLSYNRVDLHTIETDITGIDKRPNKADLLDRIDLFDTLSPEKRAELANGMQERFYRAKETLVAQGEEGSSLFIVAEGLAGVRIANESGQPSKVAHLEPGRHFGEMSLLTGAPRTATVYAETDVICYEISKELLMPILRDEPGLMNNISRMITKRQKMISELKTTREEATPTADRNVTEVNLLGRIRSFFGLP